MYGWHSALCCYPYFHLLPVVCRPLDCFAVHGIQCALCIMCIYRYLKPPLTLHYSSCYTLFAARNEPLLEKTYFKMTVIRIKIDKRVLMEGYLRTGFGSFLTAIWVYIGLIGVLTVLRFEVDSNPSGLNLHAFPLGSSKNIRDFFENPGNSLECSLQWEPLIKSSCNIPRGRYSKQSSIGHLDPMTSLRRAVGVWPHHNTLANTREVTLA